MIRALLVALCILINTVPAMAGFFSGGGSGGLTGIAVPHAQGDVPYGDTTTTWAALAKDTNATRALCNTGASNNPAWCQINLTNGVTGTLPIANGGTGITSWGAGVATWVGTPSSANLATAITDETGSGKVVFDTSPVLVTPTIGAATATSVNKVAITAPATSATITVVDGSTMGNGLTPTSHAASESATAATLWGNQLHLVTGAYTVTLPATTAGMSATFCSTTAAVFSIDLTGSDAWTLAGTALTAANKITSSGAAGECVYFVVTATNVVRTIWTVGVFIDGGA